MVMMALRKLPHPEAPREARPRRSTTFFQPYGILAQPRGGFLLGGAAAVREALLLAGDELEQGGAAVFGLAAGAQDRVADLRRVIDALAPAAEVARNVRIIAAEVACPVALVRQRHRMGLDRHRRVVQDDRQDRDAATRRGLEIETGQPERRIAHEVDAEFVGCGDLGADREAKPGAKLMRLSPTDIAARPGRPIEDRKSTRLNSSHT